MNFSLTSVCINVLFIVNGCNSTHINTLKLCVVFETILVFYFFLNLRFSGTDLFLKKKNYLRTSSSDLYIT